MPQTPDKVAVSRQANELAASHGLGARRQAKALAEEAAKAGDKGLQDFWLAVAAELNPRCSI